MSKVRAIRWWLTGPTRWQADLLKASGKVHRPGYDVSEQGRIEGASTREEALGRAAVAVSELAQILGVDVVRYDKLATDMLWDENEQAWPCLPKQS